MKTSQAVRDANARYRAKIRHAGLCWNCHQPSVGRNRCSACSASRQVDFKKLDARTQQVFPQPDRRWNGHPAQVLQWALMQHRYTEEA